MYIDAMREVLGSCRCSDDLHYERCAGEEENCNCQLCTKDDERCVGNEDIKKCRSYYVVMCTKCIKNIIEDEKTFGMSVNDVLIYCPAKCMKRGMKARGGKDADCIIVVYPKGKKKGRGLREFPIVITIEVKCTAAKMKHILKKDLSGVIELCRARFKGKKPWEILENSPSQVLEEALSEIIKKKKEEPRSLEKELLKVLTEEVSKLAEEVPHVLKKDYGELREEEMKEIASALEEYLLEKPKAGLIKILDLRPEKDFKKKLIIILRKGLLELLKKEILRVLRKDCWGFNNEKIERTVSYLEAYYQLKTMMLSKGEMKNVVSHLRAYFQLKHTNDWLKDKLSEENTFDERNVISSVLVGRKYYEDNYAGNECPEITRYNKMHSAYPRYSAEKLRKQVVPCELILGAKRKLWTSLMRQK